MLNMKRSSEEELSFMNKVRVGFIGVGTMAEHHIKMLQHIDHAEVTAVHDINAERAKEIGKTYGAEVYQSSEELMDSGKVDALFICTPPFARDGLEEAAAAKGIPLFVEKPAGLDRESARKKWQAIQQAGIIHSSGYCLRYLETVQKAKRYLEGKPVNLIIAFRIGFLPPLPWWTDQRLSGGQMVDQTTHQVDLVRYLTGDEFREARSLYAQRSIRNEVPDATIPDVGVVQFVMRSGAVGSIVTSCVSRHCGRGDVEVYGPNYYVSISGHTLKIYDDGQKLEESCDTNFYLEQNRAFIEAVRTGRQELVLCGYDEAVATLEATLAFNESAETGQIIRIK
jgi:myo-inositol 2-dehydrogenase/D-chiro-inositol 1-dehydrogenase